MASFNQLLVKNRLQVDLFYFVVNFKFHFKSIIENLIVVQNYLINLTKFINKFINVNCF